MLKLSVFNRIISSDSPVVFALEEKNEVRHK